MADSSLPQPLIRCAGPRLGEVVLPKFELHAGEWIRLVWPARNNMRELLLLTEGVAGSRSMEGLEVSTRLRGITGQQSPRKLARAASLHRIPIMGYVGPRKLRQYFDRPTLLQLVQGCGGSVRAAIELQAAFAENHHVYVALAGMDPMGIINTRRLIGERPSHIAVLELELPCTDPEVFESKRLPDRVLQIEEIGG